MADGMSCALGGDVDVREVCDIALEAGQVIMAVYASEFEVERKSDESPVTAADRASHDLISRRLRERWPDIPILSEEAADVPYEVRCRWPRLWLVDPLDGTKEFINRNGEFTVNIALVERRGVTADETTQDKAAVEEGAHEPVWEPVLGVIYAPALDVLYFGARGSGAWRLKGGGGRMASGAAAGGVAAGGAAVSGQGMGVGGMKSCDPSWRLEAIRALGSTAGDGLVVAVSRSHPSEKLDRFLASLDVRETIMLGSSLKFCAVAEGRADLYPRFGRTMEWDTAAGQAVVETAGGRVVEVGAVQLSYNKRRLSQPGFVVISSSDSALLSTLDGSSLDGSSCPVRAGSCAN